VLTRIEAQGSVERIDLFTLRLIAYAPAATQQRWIAEEVSGLRCEPYFATSLRAAFDALAEEYRRRVFIIDYDALTKEELVALRALRNRVPGGTFIALGNVREHLRAPLRVTHVLPRPLGSEVLRDIIDELARVRETVDLRL